MKLTHCVLAVTAVFALSCAQSAAQNPSSAHVRIKPQDTHQTIDGWEFVTRVWEMDKRNNAYSDEWLNYHKEIINGLVNDMGFNRIRLEVRSGTENPVDYWSQFVSGNLGYRDLRAHFYEKINDNDDPDIAVPGRFQWSNLDYFVENLALPMKAAIEARGEKLYVNLCYVDFKPEPGQTNLSHAQEPEEYAELIEETFKHLREKYGLTPDGFEIILEPDNTRDWRGREIADGLVALARRLDKIDIAPEFIAPSTSHAGRAISYFNDFARNREALERLSVFAYHRYDGKRSRGVLQAIAARAKREGLKTAMLEYDVGRIDHLFDDLIDARAVAWLQYSVPYQAIAADPARTKKESLKPIENMAALASVFISVRRGAVRLGAETLGGSPRVMAFRNTEGSHAIFVLVDEPGVVTIEGAPAGAYQTAFSALDNTFALDPVTIGADRKTFVVSPGAGLITLTQRANSPSN